MWVLCSFHVDDSHYNRFECVFPQKIAPASQHTPPPGAPSETAAAAPHTAEPTFCPGGPAITSDTLGAARKPGSLLVRVRASRASYSEVSDTNTYRYAYKHTLSRSHALFLPRVRANTHTRKITKLDTHITRTPCTLPSPKFASTRSSNAVTSPTHIPRGSFIGFVHAHRRSDLDDILAARRKSQGGDGAVAGAPAPAPIVAGQEDGVDSPRGAKEPLFLQSKPKIAEETSPSQKTQPALDVWPTSPVQNFFNDDAEARAFEQESAAEEKRNDAATKDISRVLPAYVTCQDGNAARERAPPVRWSRSALVNVGKQVHCGARSGVYLFRTGRAMHARVLCVVYVFCCALSPCFSLTLTLIVCALFSYKVERNHLHRVWPLQPRRMRP